MTKSDMDEDAGATRRGIIGGVSSRVEGQARTMKNKVKRVMGAAIEDLMYSLQVNVSVSVSPSEDLIQYSRSLGGGIISPTKCRPGDFEGRLFAYGGATC